MTYSIPYFDEFENYRCREFNSPSKALAFFFYISGLQLTAALYADSEYLLFNFL